MLIDYHNIESLILKDKKLMCLLPEYQPYFQQWLLGQRIPALRFISQRAILDLLEKLNNTQTIAILEEYLKEEVSFESIDYHVVKNMKVPISELQKTLHELGDMQKNISISRDADHSYLSFWK